MTWFATGQFNNETTNQLILNKPKYDKRKIALKATIQIFDRQTTGNTAINRGNNFKCYQKYIVFPSLCSLQAIQQFPYDECLNEIFHILNIGALLFNEQCAINVMS
jgi:hypothetical protein